MTKKEKAKYDLLKKVMEQIAEQPRNSLSRRLATSALAVINNCSHKQKAVTK
ncbi:MAG: hypothetical protein ABFD50_06475 [Smithella sp.]